MAFEVNKKQCSTCIFGANSPISKARFKELKRAWQNEDTHQECHSSNIAGGKVVCRGYHDAAVNGAVNMGQLMRIAGRLNMIKFVDVPDKD